MKQQRELAIFYAGRIRDLGTPLIMAWQTLPLLFSVVALLVSGKVFGQAELPSVLFMAAVTGVGLVFVIRHAHERRALQVKAEYEREHELIFGEPPRIDLIGFALPVKPRRRTQGVSALA